MELSAENENYIKLAFIILEIVPKHLRTCFIQLWDAKYPNEPWQGDTAKRDQKLHNLLTKGTKAKKPDIYVTKILNGNEQEWDTTTLVRAMIDVGLNLIPGCRPQGQRSSPLRDSEKIDIIRGIRNSFYGHVLSMSCSNAEFNDTIGMIKSVSKNIFSVGAENDIEKIELSPITPSMAQDVKQLLQEIQLDIEQLRQCLSSQIEKLTEAVAVLTRRPESREQQRALTDSHDSVAVSGSMISSFNITGQLHNSPLHINMPRDDDHKR